MIWKVGDQAWFKYPPHGYVKRYIGYIWPDPIHEFEYVLIPYMEYDWDCRTVRRYHNQLFKEKPAPKVRRRGRLPYTPEQRAAKLELKREFIMGIYRDYLERGTYQAVANKYRVTRQRIEQVLKYGYDNKWFPKKKKLGMSIVAEKLPSPEVFVKLLARCRNMRLVAEKLDVPIGYLRARVRQLGIVNRYKMSTELQKIFYVEKYKMLAERFGHYPTTTELVNTNLHSIQRDTSRLWGGFRNFCFENGFPIAQDGAKDIKRIHALAVKTWQKRREVKRQHLLNWLHKNPNQTFKHIRYHFKFSEMALHTMLKQLMQEKKIKRIREESNAYLYYV